MHQRYKNHERHGILQVRRPDLRWGRPVAGREPRSLGSGRRPDLPRGTCRPERIPGRPVHGPCHQVPAMELTQERSTAIISAVRSHFLHRADEVQQGYETDPESRSPGDPAHCRCLHTVVCRVSRSAPSSREMPSRKSWRTSLLSSAGSRSGSRSSRSCSTGGRKARPRRFTGRLQGCPSAFCPRNEKR